MALGLRVLETGNFAGGGFGDLTSDDRLLDVVREFEKAELAGDGGFVDAEPFRKVTGGPVILVDDILKRFGQLDWIEVFPGKVL